MNLRKATNNWMNKGGIFWYLDQNAGTPWKGEVDPLSLDLDYYGNYSGGKMISDLVKHMLDEETHVLPSSSMQALTILLLAKYGLSWSRMWEAVTTEYKPLDNYSMTEQLGVVTSNQGQADTTGSVWGFNDTSLGGSNSDKSVANSSGSGTENRTLTRSGNIGVTTSAQMLTQEMEVRRKSFFEEVYRNIDEVLIIPIYEDCEFDEYSGGGGGGSSYVLPPATADTLGGVKIGPGINVTADGTISTDTPESPVTSVNGKTGAVTITAEDLGAEETANKVTTISASSTDTEYPSAKCVYDLLGDVESALDSIIALVGGAAV